MVTFSFKRRTVIIMKIVSIVAALFIVTCLFISTTVAESKVVEKKEITHVEIKKTGERAGGGKETR